MGRWQPVGLTQGLWRDSPASALFGSPAGFAERCRCRGCCFGNDSPSRGSASASSIRSAGMFSISIVRTPSLRSRSTGSFTTWVTGRPMTRSATDSSKAATSRSCASRQRKSSRMWTQRHEASLPRAATAAHSPSTVLRTVPLPIASRRRGFFTPATVPARAASPSTPAPRAWCRAPSRTHGSRPGRRAARTARRRRSGGGRRRDPRRGTGRARR